MPKDHAACLHRRQAERDALLARIEAALRADERVVAVWLAGSLGRGDADALSDLDLWVIVRDEAVDAVTVDPRAFVAAIAVPCLVIEAPRNAPPGGAYLFTHFSGETGAHQVDWYWQAVSRAARPADTALLFERSPIPTAEPPDALPPFELQSQLETQVAEFWATVLITAKYIGRGRHAVVARQAGYLAQWLATMRRLLDHGSAPTFDDMRSAKLIEPFPPTAAAQLQLLDSFLTTMDGLEQELVSLGVPIPDDDKRQVRRFLELIRALTASCPAEA